MFLLVPAQPGCPRQNPKSRKMVMCVCVAQHKLLAHRSIEWSTYEIEVSHGPSVGPHM